MVAKKRGLGRGLDALLASVKEEEAASEAATRVAAEGGYTQLSVDQLQRGKYQPRRDLEPQALEELAASIRAQGVMQPIVVRPISDEQYEIIAGERRWRASQMADLQTIPAIIRDVPDDAAIAMALIENIQRENLNPMEEAMALSRLQQEFELTQQQVADAVGKSRSTVTNLLRLMKLSEGVRRMLEAGDLEMGHARTLLTLDDNLQKQVADEIVANELSVRDTEALVRKVQRGTSASTVVKSTVESQPEIEQWSGELSKKLAVPVKIVQNAKGKGRITIPFDSSDTLKTLLSQLS